MREVSAVIAEHTPPKVIPTLSLSLFLFFSFSLSLSLSFSLCLSVSLSLSLPFQAAVNNSLFARCIWSPKPQHYSLINGMYILVH